MIRLAPPLLPAAPTARRAAGLARRSDEVRGPTRSPVGRLAALLALGLLASGPAWADPAADEPDAETAAAQTPSEPSPQIQPPPLQVAAATSPAPAPAVVQPSPAGPPAETRFDLSVHQAPAVQVFLQIAQGTPYNMLVSPDVSGQISLTLRDTTLIEALETLRELFGYDFRIQGNRVFVYSNAVQTRLYKINYLPGRRQGASDVRVSSSAISQSMGGAGANGAGGGGSGGSGGGGSGGGGGSSQGSDNAQVRTTSDSDFWREVQASLTALVGTAEGRSVVLNPAAGVVVVKARPSELRQVENYIRAVQLSIERQVMLEAKIIEVRLGNDSTSGINWSVFGKVLGDKLGATIGALAPAATIGGGKITLSDGTSITPGAAAAAAGSLGRGFYGLAFQHANFAALLNFLQTQGEVSVLSSPRIATLNNQKAVLKVGSDEMYVTGISTSTTSSASASTTTPSVTLTPFFSGISLDVTPQIDDAGNVMLHVHPTVSTVTEKSKTIDLGSMGGYRLPLATSAVNETDSIVRVKNGQIVAIGGLMKTETSREATGVPGLQDAPVFGSLFRQSAKLSNKRELVILLKPTVIPADGAWPVQPGATAAALAAEALGEDPAAAAAVRR